MMRSPFPIDLALQGSGLGYSPMRLNRPGERPARRPRDGQEGPVQVPGRPTVVTEVSEGHRGVAPLYLHGLSTGDFAPALEGFFGSAAGLSASVITRLTTTWQAEHRAFMGRSLSDRDYVYIPVDGVHFNVCLEEDRLCCLVVVGVRLDGRRSSSRSRTATGSRRRPGRCCATFATGVCAHRSSPSATVRSGSS